MGAGKGGWPTVESAGLVLIVAPGRDIDLVRGRRAGGVERGPCVWGVYACGVCSVVSGACHRWVRSLTS